MKQDKTIGRQAGKSTILEVKDLKIWFPIKRGVFSRTVGYVKAVDGVSLYINRGETLGLVGESGCGKTTLGRSILGLEKVYEGVAFFGDRSISTMSRGEFRELRKSIQMIFQDPLSSLNPRMNVLDIITEGLAEFDMIKGGREDHAKRLVKEVGLAERDIYRFPHEFSGGQRQRISIARAISLRPDFIVCDEPVSALDVSVQAQVVNLLIDLQDRYHLSYLFISHDLSVVRHIADRVAVMYLGRIVEEGPTDDIINNPMHPYTKILISAVPEPGSNKKKNRIAEGEAPSPSSPPAGCRFHPRCPEVMDICSREEPKPIKFGSRCAWCHLYNR